MASQIIPNAATTSAIARFSAGVPVTGSRSVAGGVLGGRTVVTSGIEVAVGAPGVG
ncbi:hypothetical protein [Desulfobaculum sp.]